ncbi:alpha/beta hydrolase [Aureisphaera sp. CAU 1614]|uniref:Alpha/beta hydrolase n=1 Tax=Halomarinibacterium sedimenti TaxID=2857106 RepID=A0A9X1FMG9_9FLAO|nr:alpha/beta hydrolase-fold protein [Halomarinibacterium sedimenti]MBW2936614.1 alpha/beta hydrolase [Halomarinibacterium sedimenti]
MKKLAVLFLLIVQTSFAQEKKPFSIGETVTVFSEILKEERTLNIYLPQGYPASEKKYPVIYLLDGSADEDFIHIAGLVQFGSFSWINMIPETIVVGIANVDRKRDFTFPTQNEQDKKDFPTTGGSEKFIQFLENELQPYIQKNYQVTDEKTIIGQSLGGLLATEILFKNPELFNNYIIVSPSMWWDDESLLSQTPQMPSFEKKIYIAVGSEGPTMETGAIKLRYKLQKYYDTKALVYFNLLVPQNHGDALHLAVYDAFEKILKAEMK